MAVSAVAYASSAASAVAHASDVSAAMAVAYAASAVASAASAVAHASATAVSCVLFAAGLAAAVAVPAFLISFIVFSRLRCMASAVFLGASAIASAVFSALTVWFQCLTGGINAIESDSTIVNMTRTPQIDASMMPAILSLWLMLLFLFACIALLISCSSWSVGLSCIVSLCVAMLPINAVKRCRVASVLPCRQLLDGLILSPCLPEIRS